MAHWKKSGFGTCVVVHKETNRGIGLSGFKYLQIEGKEVIDIGGIGERRYQGCGLAMECARSLIAHGFKFHAFPKITASVTPANTVARILLKRLGFTFIREAEVKYAGKTFPKVLYWELLREGSNTF